MAATRRKPNADPDESDVRERMAIAAADGKAMQHVAWVNLLTFVLEHFGIASALLVFCLGAIWVLGSAKTHDDFIRMMLFGEGGSLSVRLFFVGLMVLTLLNSSTWFRRWSRDSKEVKRIADEKSRLQEKLIGTELSHTQKGPEA